MEILSIRSVIRTGGADLWDFYVVHGFQCGKSHAMAAFLGSRGHDLCSYGRIDSGGPFRCGPSGGGSWDCGRISSDDDSGCGFGIEKMPGSYDYTHVEPGDASLFYGFFCICVIDKSFERNSFF